MRTSRIKFARLLRNNPTDAESKLWYFLSRKNLGVKFRRQAPIGKYIVDFVCYEKGLVVEVDGSQHFESIKDHVRDAWLKSQGFSILRFWDNQVLENPDGVTDKIFERLQTPSLNPSPQGGGKQLRRSL